MSKIIKPLLNEDGTQVKRALKKGEWYYSIVHCDYAQWYKDTCEFQYLVYYEEKWKPKENEFYWFYNFLIEKAINYKRNTYTDVLSVEVGNCFQTEEEAEDINNILTVLDNMKAYYQKKQEAKNG